MKRIVLPVILASLSLSAWALEPMSDDSMAAAVGQSGLTVLVSPISASANHIRYADGDGFTGHSSPGALDISNFNLSQTSSTRLTLDIGTSGSGASAKTGLMLGISPITNMSITTGSISVDNGSALVIGSNSYSFADLSLTNINVSAVDLMVTPGGQTSSGFTVLTLTPLNVSASAKIDDLVNGGIVKTDVSMKNLMTSFTGDVTNTNMQLAFNSGSIGSIKFANVRMGADIPGNELGSFTVSNVNFSNSTVQISGH